MKDIILFDYWRSSASYRVRIALNLKNVPYTRVPTSLLDNQQKAPDYVARNPQGFVPMLSIDGHDLTQSLAIIDYLDANYPDPRNGVIKPGGSGENFGAGVDYCR
jgi:maleylacetoacetate isomerase